MDPCQHLVLNPSSRYPPNESCCVMSWVVLAYRGHPWQFTFFAQVFHYEMGLLIFHLSALDRFSYGQFLVVGIVGHQICCIDKWVWCFLPSCCGEKVMPKHLCYPNKWVWGVLFSDWEQKFVPQILVSFFQVWVATKSVVWQVGLVFFAQLLWGKGLMPKHLCYPNQWVWGVLFGAWGKQFVPQVFHIFFRFGWQTFCPQSLESF